MRRIVALLLLIASLFIPFILAAQDREDNWRIVKSTHFIIHYMNAQDEFLSRLIDRGEDYYNRIADDLGFRRFNFWLWENRAHIYVYDTSHDYQTLTGQPSWSSGGARVKEKTIYTFLEAPEFFDQVLPHEMGHIIFREFVGFDNPAIPRWLDEGVASYQEKSKRSLADIVIREAMHKGTLINLDGLSAVNPYISQDVELVNLFYAESVSIVDYLVKEFGSDAFISFCQDLRDKRDLTRAIRYAYRFETIQDLDEAWQRHLRK